MPQQILTHYSINRKISIPNVNPKLEKNVLAEEFLKFEFENVTDPYLNEIFRQIYGIKNSVNEIINYPRENKSDINPVRKIIFWI